MLSNGKVVKSHGMMRQNNHAPVLHTYIYILESSMLIIVWISCHIEFGKTRSLPYKKKYKEKVAKKACFFKAITYS